MSIPIITLENVNKSYIISHQLNSGDENTLRDKIVSATKSFTKREKLSSYPSKEEFWALRDISFEVQQGERLAIIGGNGAGKSTLFKILSRITAPTKGKITIEGRVASLLEVGTGFHPELSGRENIFLNGTILGMGRKEIINKFDEIVEFSGVEKFLDTPVKRFSSGMYVRLAFAIAAHLESEILIIDEVLAVGDAEFQKKCLGKMQDVSQNGRTILFVSHAMTTIQSLCTKGIFLKNGAVQKYGEINEVVNEYLSFNKNANQKLSEITSRRGNGLIRFKLGSIGNKTNIVEPFDELKITLDYILEKHVIMSAHTIEIVIQNRSGLELAHLSSNVLINTLHLVTSQITFTIQDLPLAPGEYSCTLCALINQEIADKITEVLSFTIIEKESYEDGIQIKNLGFPVLLKYTIN